MGKFRINDKVLDAEEEKGNILVGTIRGLRGDLQRWKDRAEEAERRERDQAITIAALNKELRALRGKK